jgi:hypothetical protein
MKQLKKNQTTLRCGAAALSALAALCLTACGGGGGGATPAGASSSQVTASGPVPPAARARDDPGPRADALAQREPRTGAGA